MNQYLRIAIGLALGAVLVGCAGGGGGGVYIPFPTQNEPGVRLFNGLDGQSTITALFRDTNLNVLGRSNSAAYGGASNDTVLTNTNVTATINGPNGAIFTTAPNLVRINSFYTLYVGGPAGSSYTQIMLQDSQSVLAHRTIGLRAIQLSANTNSVDIYFAPGTTFSPSATLFTNVVYGNFTGPSNAPVAVDPTGYLAEPISGNSFTYTVFVTAHGSQTVLAQQQLNPISETSYSIAIYDTVPGTGTSVTILPDVRND